MVALADKLLEYKCISTKKPLKIWNLRVQKHHFRSFGPNKCLYYTKSLRCCEKLSNVTIYETNHQK